MTGNPADRAGAILEIDLAGIAANWRLLARRVEPAECAAVVKANAYGLGAPQVAPVLAAARIGRDCCFERAAARLCE
jgi:alanine racemase